MTSTSCSPSELPSGRSVLGRVGAERWGTAPNRFGRAELPQRHKVGCQSQRAPALQTMVGGWDVMVFMCERQYAENVRITAQRNALQWMAWCSSVVISFSCAAAGHGGMQTKRSIEAVVLG